MTNRDLYRYHIEAMELKKTFIGFLLKGNIDAFYKRESKRILILQDKINELQNKYLIFEDGKLKVDENGESITKEGHTKDELNKEYNDLLSQEVSTIRLLK